MFSIAPKQPIWIEQVKHTTKTATPRTTCATTPSSRGSMNSRMTPSIFSYGSEDTLGDGGSFEKLFSTIPEHLRSSRVVNFYENQLDWSQDGVHAVFQTKKHSKHQEEELAVDWTASYVPRFQNNFWEFQRDWSQNGLPIEKELAKDVTIDWSGKGIPAEMVVPLVMQMNWAKNGLPHQFQVGKHKSKKLSDELMVNWSKRGVPVKNSWWSNPMVDWSQDKLPEIWENATPNEIKFVSFMPGPFHWYRPSFWEMPMLDWSKMGMPRIFRKVCQKSAGHAREIASVDWTGHGMPVAFRRLETLEKPLIVDWSKSGVPVTNYFVEERGLDWSSEGVPNPFKIGTRFPDVPVCDWSGSGIPMQMPRAYASDDILCINWQHKGMPKQFKDSVWDQLMLDWSGAHIPRAMRVAVDRFDYVFAKRLADFFKPPEDKNNFRVPYEVRIDWSVKGLPTNAFARVEQKQEEELSLDWSFRLPPTAFRSTKWDFLALDWSVDGLPRMSERGTKWNPLVIDWSSVGRPQQFRMTPEAFWDGPSVDWMQNGVPTVFNANIGREHQMELDWSVCGVPKDFQYMAKYEHQLRVDWLASGLPVQFKFWNHSFVDWSMDGMPQFFNMKQNRKRRQQANELMINWARKGIPKVFHTTKWDFFAFDWSANGLCTFEQIPGAKATKLDCHYFNLDWSLTGLPMPNSRRFRQYTKDWIVDWCQQGVPLMFKRDFPPLALDWSANDVPHQFMQGQFETSYSLNWAAKGIPDAFKQRYLDMPYMDWNASGIPHIFNVNPAAVSCRICRLNPQPIKDYIFDWSARGLPLKTTFYDYPMFNWAAKGLPIAGKPQNYEFDWSAAGVPYPQVKHSVVFQPEMLRVSELSEPRLLTMMQEDLCFEGKDMHSMTTVRLPRHKSDIYNPWNRLTDNRREAKFLSQARHTKKTKRAFRYLRYIQSKQMEVRDRKEKNKYVTMKRNHQRLDKRVRRGDCAYEGEPYIDEAPITSVFDDWPYDTVTKMHEEMIAALMRTKIRRAAKGGVFEDWPHQAVAMVHQMDVDAMRNKYIYFADFRQGL